MTRKLTDRQRQILDLIKTIIAETGAPPTRAEISTALGFKSANAAQEHLQALAQKGMIDLVSGASRGIRLRGEAKLMVVDTSQLPPEHLALPLIGRVAAGSPILAQEHVDQTYHIEVIELHPENPDSPTITVRPGEPFVIEGLAVGLIRNSMLV